MTDELAGLGPVLPQHRFDEAALARCLGDRLPGFDGDVRVRQFQVGQSNPTYHLHTTAGDYVLRKKPAGKLLPSAHAVDREYTVMRALADSGVPVPTMHLLCTDESVIGQMFYVMDYVPGRNLPDPRLPDAPAEERRAMYLDLVTVLAHLHRVDYRAVGLEDFGRPDGYVARQVARWSTQYEASRVEENADMDRLIDWLRRHMPEGDETSIVHGDYRTHNVLFHPVEPHVVTVLDWELATIGHPLSDLAYCCLPYNAPADDNRGFQGEDPAALGIPTESELIDAYCREAGRPGVPDWQFFVIFSLFRSAAIRAGIYKRALDGNAASAQALEAGLRYRGSARRGWQLAQQA